MSAPNLAHRLELQTRVLTPDGAGGFDVSWTPLGIHHAQLVPASGRQQLEGLRAVSTVPWTITVRAAPHDAPSRPRPEQRFVLGTRVFEIQTVSASRDPLYLECLAIEGVQE